MIKTQRHKERKGFLDTKTTSDLKVATKPCGREIFVDCGREIFVAFVKAALLLSLSSAAEKEHCVFVSLCLKLLIIDYWLFIIYY